MFRAQTARIPRALGLYARAVPVAPARVAHPAARGTLRLYSDEKKAEAPADGAGGAAAAADGNAAEPATEEKSEWQVKFEQKDKEAAKFKEAWQRSVADFRNLQKTTEAEVKKSQQYALQKFARDLIESVDNFDLAMAALPADKLDASSSDIKEFHKGVHMVQQVLEKTLAKHGIVKVNPMNEKFDPNEHEALFQLPQEGKEPGTIFHVDRTGFKLYDRVLRAPKVGFVADPEQK